MPDADIRVVVAKDAQDGRPVLPGGVAGENIRRIKKPGLVRGCAGEHGCGGTAGVAAISIGIFIYYRLFGEFFQKGRSVAPVTINGQGVGVQGIPR